MDARRKVKNMINVRKIDSIKDLENLREEYMNSLQYSQEQYFEHMINKCTYYVIEFDSKIIGYFCVSSYRVLYEFYLSNEVIINSQDIFSLILDQEYIVSAECKSFDHLLLSLGCDFNKKAICTGYLFRDYINVTNSLNGFDDIIFRLAELKDKKEISDKSEDFFKKVEEQIIKNEIFVLYSKNILLGTGVIQKVFPDLNYYDIGMIVDKNNRNKGIGTFIIAKLKEYCSNNNWIPVCGCGYNNAASKRTLEKAGFITKHRIIRFDFYE